MMYLTERMDNAGAKKLKVTAVNSFPNNQNASQVMCSEEGLSLALEAHFEGEDSKFYNIDSKTCVYFKAV